LTPARPGAYGVEPFREAAPGSIDVRE
jgi:hypothetical protein